MSQLRHGFGWLALTGDVTLAGRFGAGHRGGEPMRDGSLFINVTTPLLQPLASHTLLCADVPDDAHTRCSQQRVRLEMPPQV